jgi:hypothetical protein
VQKVKQQLKNGNIFFGIQIDASNVKNRIFFPITVQYFDTAKGILNKIINFIENPDETATGMFKSIEKTLLNLSFEKVSCLSADNCNANFGRNHSFFTELLEKNSNIIKANPSNTKYLYYMKEIFIKYYIVFKYLKDISNIY